MLRQAYKKYLYRYRKFQINTLVASYEFRTLVIIQNFISINKLHFMTDLLLSSIALAEEAGFEPATELPLCHLSRVVPSTAQPLIRILILDLHTWKPTHYIAQSPIIPMQIARQLHLSNKTKILLSSILHLTNLLT